MCIPRLVLCCDCLCLITLYRCIVAVRLICPPTRGITVICPGVFGIGYKGRALTGSSSLDTAPVTGSLLFNAPVCHLAVYCAVGFSLCVLFGGCDSIWLAVFGLFVRRVSVYFVMATDGDATAGARSGITFGVTLDVPWKAPEFF